MYKELPCFLFLHCRSQGILHTELYYIVIAFCNILNDFIHFSVKISRYRLIVHIFSVFRLFYVFCSFFIYILYSLYFITKYYFHNMVFYFSNFKIPFTFAKGIYFYRSLVYFFTYIFFISVTSPK